MNTLKLLLLCCFCYQFASADFQNEVSHLVQDIVTRLAKSEPGVHDVAFVNVGNSVLEKAFQNVSKSGLVTAQLIGGEAYDCDNRKVSKKLSLILVDWETFTIDGEYFMKKLHKCGLWQSKTKVVLFLLEDSVRLQQEIANVLKLYGCSSVLFVIYKNINLQYFIMNFFSTEMTSVYNPVNDLFEPKLLTVNRYSFKILINQAIPFHKYVDEHSAIGIDAKLVEMIVSHLNGTLSYRKTAVDTEVLVDSSNIFAQRQLFDFSLKYTQEMINFDQLFLPHIEHICVTVPKRHKRVLFRQLSQPFRATVWIVTMLVVSYFMIKKSDIVALTIVEFNSKFVDLTFEIISFILMEAYLAKVIAFLTTMQYEPNFRTLAELDQIEQPIAVNPFEKSLLSKYPNLKFKIDQIHKNVLIHTHSTVGYCKVVEYWYQSKLNYNPETNDRRVYILDERLTSVQLFYTFAIYSPFTERFQECIDRLAGAGIWDKVFNQWSISQEQFEAFLNPDDQMIKFEDLKSFWVVALIGYLVGICVFVIEKMKILLKIKQFLEKRTIYDALRQLK